MAKRRHSSSSMPEGSRRRRRRQQQPVFVFDGDFSELMLMLDEYVAAANHAKMVKKEKKSEFHTVETLRYLSAQANKTYQVAREKSNSIYIDLQEKLAAGFEDLLQLQKLELDYAEATEKASKAKKEKKRAFDDLNERDNMPDEAKLRFQTAREAKLEKHQPLCYKAVDLSGRCMIIRSVEHMERVLLLRSEFKWSGTVQVPRKCTIVREFLQGQRRAVAEKISSLSTEVWQLKAEE